MRCHPRLTSTALAACGRYVCSVMFCSLAVLDPRVGHTMDVLLVHGQVTIIFVVSVGLSVCLFVCLFVQIFSQLSLIQFRSNLEIGLCYMSGSSCVT